MGRLQDKVAFITGAARGQGRSHAVRFAKEGAAVIALDACSPIETQPYSAGTEEDLAETVRLVEGAGGRIVAGKADVRDSAQITAVFEEGVRKLGAPDIVVANAGTWSFGLTWEIEDQQWQDMIDINLTGSWRTVKASIPTMIDAGKGGSVILISSMCGVAGFYGLTHYCAAKHGVVGMARVMAQELGPHKIRVNAICPTSVDTDMFNNPAMRKTFVPGADNPTDQEFREAARDMHPLGVSCIEVQDVTNNVVFLASDEARYTTGQAVVVDAGCLVKH
ncbi:MAG: mycofactocin-coupled SDR family oxidoreductase [Beutenbergiaceae bacterium]